MNTLIIGNGTQYVYLYYFPADQADAIRKGNWGFKCNIGMTERDYKKRISEQVHGSSESPIIPLAIKTEDGRSLEAEIHKVLKSMDKHLGKENFRTCPSEVLNLYLKYHPTEKMKGLPPLY